MNTMARYGVIGNGIQIQVTPEFVEAFAAIDVTLTNEMGEVFDRARGSALMGNPFKAILWLVNHLKEHNKKLRAGDSVSLGSLGKLFPPKAGQSITLHNRGLPGVTGEAVVHFK